MPNLQGPPAELRFTLTIKRKDSGKEETFEFVGRTTGDAPPINPDEKEPENGSHPLDSGS